MLVGVGCGYPQTHGRFYKENGSNLTTPLSPVMVGRTPTEKSLLQGKRSKSGPPPPLRFQVMRGHPGQRRPKLEPRLEH